MSRWVSDFFHFVHRDNLIRCTFGRFYNDAALLVIQFVVR